MKDYYGNEWINFSIMNKWKSENKNVFGHGLQINRENYAFLRIDKNYVLQIKLNLEKENLEKLSNELFIYENLKYINDYIIKNKVELNENLINDFYDEKIKEVKGVDKYLSQSLQETKRHAKEILKAYNEDVEDGMKLKVFMEVEE